jgi:hypothetical protein
MLKKPNKQSASVLLIATVLCGLSTSAVAAKFTSWEAPVNAEIFSGNNGSPNSPQSDGCPILDPYNNDLFIASPRPGGFGGLDIWIAAWNGEGWDEPVNAGPTINSAADDFCPTPARGNRLFFVTKREDPKGDIYVAKRLPGKGFTNVQRLSAVVNSTAEEWSPSVFDDEAGNEVLYFSSTRGGGQDIYESVNYGTPVKVQSLSTGSSDARPNVRRDGLEIVFDSDRPGGLGSSDIWTASRSSTSATWNNPVPITQVNSPAVESRASLSWDGSTLVFGSARSGGEGSADVYVSQRNKRTGPKTVDAPAE